MKKIVLASLMLMSAISGMAQGNLQLHYDFGRNVYPDEQAERPKVTGTFEQFSLDGLGSWFYFIDMDFYNDGAAGAYVDLRSVLFLSVQRWNSTAVSIQTIQRCTGIRQLL